MADDDIKYTNELVNNRFDLAKQYADDALGYVSQYITKLNNLLVLLKMPSTDEIEDVVLPDLPEIDYNAIPKFDSVIRNIPEFNNIKTPYLDTLWDIEDVIQAITEKTFSHEHESPEDISLDYGTQPDTIEDSDITMLQALDLEFPQEIAFEDIPMPAPIDPNVFKYDGDLPILKTVPEPKEFKWEEDDYQSDIRQPLFAKIIKDITNGGTGLNANVESDIYETFLTRQRTENDRLYQEIQNQFSASGFALPTGAYASRLAQVSNDISLKNDQAIREITISQANLAQTNTHFVIDKGVVLEQMLLTFFDNQQNRSLQAATTVAENAIAIYNAILTMQGVVIEKYRSDIMLFEANTKSDLARIDAYRAQLETVQTGVSVQQLHANIYQALVATVETRFKMHQVNLDSLRVEIEFKNLVLNEFKANTEAYIARISAEQTRISNYEAQLKNESVRVDAFNANTVAYEAEIKGQLGNLEAKKTKAEIRLARNQQEIDEFKSHIDKFKAMIEAEISSFQEIVASYQIAVSAYQAQTSSLQMQYSSRIAELSSHVELAKAKMEKAKAIVETTANAYVALKNLEEKATEGVMNVNAQLAASAMNSVNASAGMSSGFSFSYDQTKSEPTYSHNYNYDSDE